MKLIKWFIPMLLCVLNVMAQPNCNFYLWKGDTLQYEACKLLTENQNKHYQFSKEFHHLLDSAIKLCPYFAYAYREKAAPYVKSGNFILWKKYIDLAVKYDSAAYLPVRASLRYKFFGDYEGTIQDIELFEKMNKDPLAYTSNGTYHLTIVKALCYKQLNAPEQSINLIESLLKNKNHSIGYYDQFHLGVMYLQKQQYDKAIEILNKQVGTYDFAEARYYLAICYKETGKTAAYEQAKALALKLYEEQNKLFDQYHYMIDQIDLKEINLL